MKKTQNHSVGRLIDNVIGVFDPVRAAKRKAARVRSELLDQFSAYRGAERGRVNGAWIPNGASADQTIIPELKTLRDRSRDLDRNDPHASGITLTMTSNTVGTGIRPQSRIDQNTLGVSRQQARAFQRIAEKEFKIWQKRADVSGRMDFYDVQALVDRQILINGEIILLPRYVKRRGCKYTFALQLIESDRLGSPSGSALTENVRDGIKIGANGEPVSYFIRKTHPGDYYVTSGKNDFDEIPAEDPDGRKRVMHLYPVLRPGQSRGVPFFSPVIEYFKNLGEYMDAELVAARISACYALIIQQENAENAALGSTYNPSTSTNETTPEGNQLETLYPGLVHYANPGEKFESFNPSRPVSSFEPFVNRILRAISASLGLPYELVAKDFSKVNYSSARAALLEARRYFRMRQRWLIAKLCQPVWELFLEEAYLLGAFGQIDYYGSEDEYTQCTWLAPGWEWIDPLKEAEAAQVGLETGTTSYSEIYASKGKDFEEELEQVKREQELISELGIKIGAAKSSPADDSSVPTPDTNEGDDEIVPEDNQD